MAKNKQFELQSVLDFKSEVEKIRLAEFSAALARHAEKEAVISAVELETSLAAAEYERLQRQCASVCDIEMYSRFISSQYEKLTALKEELSRITIDVDNARRELTVAVSEKRGFEKLKEDHLYEIKKAISRKEAEFMDEIASRRGANS